MARFRPLNITEAALSNEFGSSTVSRAIIYARQKRISRMKWSDGGLELTGWCRGSGRNLYNVTVSFVADGVDREITNTYCSCPVGFYCKHAATLLLAAADAAESEIESGSAAVPRSAPSRWRSVLGDLVGETPAAASGTAPIGIVIEMASTGHHGDTPHLRLQTPNKNGVFVRTGISWQSVNPTDRRFHYRSVSSDLDLDHFDPVHLARVREIAQAFRAADPYRPVNALLDLGEAPAHVWDLLRTAADAGVQIAAHRKSTGASTVTLLEGARAALRVDGDDDDDGLVVRPSSAVDGWEWDGRPIHLIHRHGTNEIAGVYVTDRDTLLIAPFSAPQATSAFQELLREGALRIPAVEVPDFVAEILPGLSRSMPVELADDIAVDADITGPELTATLTLDDGGRGSMVWGVAYHVNGSRRIFTDHRRAGFRDSTAERVAWEKVAPLLRRAAALCGDWPYQAAANIRSAARTGIRVDSLNPLDYSAENGIARSGIALLTSDYSYTPVETAMLVVEVIPELRASGVGVNIVGDVPDYREVAATPPVVIGTNDDVGSDWFGLSITIDLDGYAVTVADVIAELSSGATHMLAPNGAYFPLDSPEILRLAELVSEAGELGEIESGRVRRDTYNATLWEELLELGVVDKELAQWHQRVGRLAAATPPVPCPIPAAFDAELRDYQQIGLNWLNFLWQNRIGGILADDMGLGKTVQTLAMIAAVLDEVPDGRFLVVAPTSVISNWVAESVKFTPGLAVTAVIATSGRTGVPLAEHVAGKQIVVTSYALMRIGFDEFDEIEWTGVLFDEAQFVKNHNAKSHQCARRLNAQIKLAITGTPMENNLMELWSLLSLTVPGLFPSPKIFTEYFRKPIESGAEPDRLALLRRRIHPVMLRRTKDQVAKDLPAKQEQVMSINLVDKHDKIYQTRLTRERQKVLGLLDEFDENRFEIFRSLTMLRQLSLHAGLVDDKHAAVASAKIDFLAEQVPELISEGHSALVFSQFTGFLGLIAERLDAIGVEHSYLDGSMTAKERGRQVNLFTRGQTKVFLISLKAGGFGLNLTEADYCFICDPWWNPAAEAQAVDRTHRLGQTRPVTVYRLVSAGTIEENVVALQNKKRDLFNAVVDDGDLFGAAISADDIKELMGG